MYSLSLPGTDWSLQLLPRFAGLGSPGQELALALLGLVPLGLLLWLYRQELRLVARAAASVLLLARLSVVALLWFVVAWQPTLAHSAIEELPSRVLIALDQSRSMDVADPQRSPLDRLRLAQALRLFPTSDLPVETLVADWIRHYQAGATEQPPAWSTGTVGSIEQRKQLHEQICQQVNRLTRGEISRLLLTAADTNRLQRLGQKHRLEILGFAQQTQILTAQQLAKPGPAAGTDGTDLSGPLRRTLERSATADGKILGVLLFSDGRHNQGEAPEVVADELGRRHIPIFPVMAAGPGTPPDITLLSVQAPPQVFKDAETTVAARFRVTGLPAQDLTVELLRDGKPVGKDSKQVVHHDGTDRDYTARFPIRLQEPGLTRLQVKVLPTRPGTVEMSQDNNQRTTVLRVAEERARVLLIEGEARWEYHYLSSALRRDQTMQPESVVFLQPRLGKIKEEELEKTGHPRLHLPEWDKTKTSVDPLYQYECIILGDVPPEKLPRADRQRLERYVADQGGTLVLLAGQRWLPLEYLTEPKGDSADPLLKMLPIEKPQVVRPKDGFAVTLTQDGGTTPYMQMNATPETSAARWAQLPRHYWGVIGQARPGATVLAYVPGAQLDDSGQKSKLAREKQERQQALLATHNYGFGRVIWVGLDSTWRWRYRAGDVYHHRFWGQLIRWAASDRLLPAGNDHVRYGSKRPVYEPDQDVEIVVRPAETLPPLKDSKAQVKILQQVDGKAVLAAVVPLQEDSGSGRLKANVRSLPAGAYRVELDIPAWQDKLPASATDVADSQGRAAFVVLPAESEETVQLAANRTLLENLARQSGGEIIPPERLEELVQRLARQTSTREQHEEQRIWQDQPLTWYLLGLFLTLLSLEWVVRKMAGLP